jgi:hypothetical protein
VGIYTQGTCKKASHLMRFVEAAADHYYQISELYIVNPPPNCAQCYLCFESSVDIVAIKVTISSHIVYENPLVRIDHLGHSQCRDSSLGLTGLAPLMGAE